MMIVIKNSLKKILTLLIFLSLTLQSCFNLRSCEEELSGKYYSTNDENIINYLELKDNGTYFHYFKKEELELSNEGSWKKSNNGYCKIELQGWKNYNEKGANYDNFIFGLLFVNGNYLDISPDGESSTSFKKSL